MITPPSNNRGFQQSSIWIHKKNMFSTILKFEIEETPLSLSFKTTITLMVKFDNCGINMTTLFCHVEKTNINSFWNIHLMNFHDMFMYFCMSQYLYGINFFHPPASFLDHLERFCLLNWMQKIKLFILYGDISQDYLLKFQIGELLLTLCDHQNIWKGCASLFLNLKKRKKCL